MKPIIVGELNPYGADPRFALYPEPPHSAGGRLCRKVLAMQPHAYRHAFDRRNLCVGKWSLPKAREAARAIEAEVGYLSRDVPIIMLGSKVCEAFGVRFLPFTSYGDGHRWHTVILPHPSGLSRLWAQPNSYQRARDLVARATSLGSLIGDTLRPGSL